MAVEFDAARLQKLKELEEQGVNAYPDRYAPTHSLKEAAGLSEGTPDVALCGRLVALRDMGNLVFGRLQDVDGAFQVIFEKKTLGPDRLKWIKKYIDVGDHLGMKGSIFRTRRGELSLMAEEIVLLSKGLLPLPEKWHGLQEVELCYRKRYLDLVANPDTRKRFLTCIAATTALRRFLEEHGFRETVTPAMAPVASGASATPFTAHHNALDLDVYFRIAPETYLKRLLVGGFTRVYEFARCFRNEGVSPEHVQDFIMIEAYAAYWNYKDNMRFVRDLIRSAAAEALGEARITFRDGTYDLDREWRVVTFREAVQEGCGIDIEALPTAEDLLAAVKGKGIDLEHPDLESLGRGSLLDLLYKRTARPLLKEPTFLTEHPIDLSPLARRNEEDAPHLIYVPEVPFTPEKFAADVQECLRRFNRCFIIVGEGIRDPDGNYVAEMGGAFGQDAFGHKQLGGAAEALRAIVEERVGVKCRTQKPGTMQRSAMHFASATDVAEAYMAGAAAVKAALEGISGKMVSLVREDGDGQYRCTTGLVDLAKVANAEKPLPREYINEAGNGVTEAFLAYARPLIAGTAEVELGDDGLPVYARLARHMVEKKTHRQYAV